MLSSQVTTAMHLQIKFSWCTKEKWMRTCTFYSNCFFQTNEFYHCGLDKPSYCTSEGHTFPTFWSLIRISVADVVQMNRRISLKKLFRLHKLADRLRLVCEELLSHFASIWQWPISLLFQRHVTKKKQVWQMQWLDREFLIWGQFFSQFPVWRDISFQFTWPFHWNDFIASRIVIALIH